MNKRGSYGSMADRVARGREERDGGRASGSPEPPPIKHCWVTTRHGRLPGLLLEWRRHDDGWRGRVVHAVDAGDGPGGGAWVVVEEWLPAGLLDGA